ncbi:MAG: serine/threonine-protein kinase, partial [Verrucomicrobiales bacterium]
MILKPLLARAASFMSPDDPLQNISDWEPPSAEDLAGRIPGYDVERLMARGGMAAVYLGKQISLDRPVALKVLPPELGQIPGFNERFASEARLLAKLHDPAIVTVIDFGHTAGGSAFIVMELVDGLPLEQWAVGRPFAEKLPVAIRLLHGVAHFQSQGVVHADLKPDNIFVTDGGAVKILDFGLATPVVGVGEVHAPRFGTPPYTAPEAYADGAKPDPRSDIYSLGITLIQLFGSGPPPDVAPPETFDVARFLGRRDLAAILEPMVSPRPENRSVGLDQIVSALRTLAQPAAPTRPATAPTRPANAPTRPATAPTRPATAATRAAAIGSPVRPAGTAMPLRNVPARPEPGAP